MPSAKRQAAAIPPTIVPAIQALLLWAPGSRDKVSPVRAVHWRPIFPDHSPEDGEVCDGRSLDVDENVDKGARLTGVARSSLICSWSVYICEE